MKEIKIQVPEGYEIDRENSTFECIKFKPKGLTYEDVAKKFFLNKETKYIDSNGTIRIFFPKHLHTSQFPNNCISTEQAEKLLALNKLINVAKYLNGDWKPDFVDREQQKWYIYESLDVEAVDWHCANLGIPCFKSEELAKQAIEILGKETIKLALSQV